MNNQYTALTRFWQESGKNCFFPENPYICTFKTKIVILKFKNRNLNIFWKTVRERAKRTHIWDHMDHKQ